LTLRETSSGAQGANLNLYGLHTRGAGCTSSSTGLMSKHATLRPLAYKQDLPRCLLGHVMQTRWHACHGALPYSSCTQGPSVPLLTSHLRQAVAAISRCFGVWPYITGVLDALQALPCNIDSVLVHISRMTVVLALPTAAKLQHCGDTAGTHHEDE
jgi:hypothetical protein